MSSFGGKPRGLISDLPNVQVIPRHKLAEPRAKSNQGFFHDQQGQIVEVPLRMALSPEPSREAPKTTFLPGRKNKKYNHVQARY
jgi:hypothetical protein